MSASKNRLRRMLAGWPKNGNGETDGNGSKRRLGNPLYSVLIRLVANAVLLTTGVADKRMETDGNGEWDHPFWRVTRLG